MHEVVGMGELPEPWHSNQMNLLTEHIRLLTEYGSSFKMMDNNEGNLSDQTLDIENIVLFLQALSLSKSQLGRQTHLMNSIPQICIFSECGRKMQI